MKKTSKVGDRLKALRAAAKLEISALAATGIVSIPGYTKIEAGHRAPSDELVGKLAGALVSERKVKATRRELLTLKYMDDSSEHVREMAAHYHATKIAPPAPVAVPS